MMARRRGGLMRLVVMVVMLGGMMVGAMGGLGAMGGCTRMRFVIDAVPAPDRMTETVVLEDDGARGLGRGSKIAMIEVNGLIVDMKPKGVLSAGENPVGRFAESLRRAEKDNAVKGVIVRINSPGGTVTATDIMYRELKRFGEETEKPIVVLMGGVAASGGYYLACAGDEVIAHPTTVTGSIGVIMQLFNFSEGMQRIGIRGEAITSGPNKAVGSPFEPMPDEHRELLRGMVNEFYGNFVAVVQEHRTDLADSDVEWVTDGRVVTGRKAAAIGLVDSVGDLHDAFAAAKERAGVLNARLVKYHRELEYVGSAYARGGVDDVGETEINLLQLRLDSAGMAEQVGFYYLWDPSVW